MSLPRNPERINCGSPSNGIPPCWALLFPNTGSATVTNCGSEPSALWKRPKAKLYFCMTEPQGCRQTGARGYRRATLPERGRFVPFVAILIFVLRAKPRRIV